MKLPPLKIGELVAAVPIIQGGMGVGVSLSGLASAVANEGGVGVISSAQIGFNEPDFENNSHEANIRAMRKEIRKARELSPKGIIAVNIMVAMNNYKEMVQVAVEEKIDLIISGAGLPTELPNLVKGSNTKIAPIVSSAKAAMVITKLWDHKFSRIPDLVIVEGPEAGGHLGFSKEELKSEEKPNLIQIVKEVIEVLKPYEEKNKKSIPVVAAGGVYTGEDIAKLIKAGAAGVQMATRFVATEECDADIKYKMAYVNSHKEDIRFVKSPVGLPGRAIHNKFLSRLDEGDIEVKKCYNCLKPCNPATTPYCISKALIEAVRGNVDEGLIFSGSNAYRVDKIMTVKELIQELVNEAERYLV
ncbi:nitronate monooxygenase family protein [Clostridium sp. SYSU_GA19001]|uniref:NAD(P)H-dependent flavin oxidoreductase n=1 Tax=Clostridium caldaquaticum TaxID=2940653 RepID=UPI002077990A|nr:nitronate monooxygenase family protein [Clostridium caldaquaticum]MCM8711773.1 nitronate monooxygenase family protein [Clostridium caldaquaticum]